MHDGALHDAATNSDNQVAEDLDEIEVELSEGGEDDPEALGDCMQEEEVVVTDAGAVMCKGVKSFAAYETNMESVRVVELNVFVVGNENCFKQQEVVSRRFNGLAFKYVAVKIMEGTQPGRQFEVAGLARMALASASPLVSPRRGRNPVFIPWSELSTCFKPN